MLIARGIVLFLGGFTLLNLVGEAYRPGFDANLWWIDLRPLPLVLTQPFLLALSLGWLVWAIRPNCRPWLRVSVCILIALAALACLINAGIYYALLIRGEIRSSLPVPLSLVMAGSLTAVLFAAGRTAGRDSAVPRPRLRRLGRGLGVAAAAMGCALLFPLLQMALLGKTDYRRPADVIVVFGARAHPDGTLSDALTDRVRTAVRLHQEGYAPVLLMSGGEVSPSMTEPQAMRRYAIELGVHPRDIWLDPQGINTEATVRQTIPIFQRQRVTRVLAVSHFYHLPRIRMAYQRQGWQVWTVPAEERYTLRQMPYLIAREVAALWVYYLRPLTG